MRLLDLEAVSAGYGDVTVLRDVSLHVDKGEIVSLVGANGAGKTTLLRAISRVLPLTGSIRFDGDDISRLRSDEIVTLGLAHVPEGRQLFGDMRVEENLMLGIPRACPRPERQRRLDYAFSLFPRLSERRWQLAGTLSGGEQQMAAIARGLMLAPRLLMLDEPSLGLSPAMVAAIFDTVRRVNADGVSVLIVEQNVVESLRHSHRAYVLETGQLVFSGAAADVLADDRVRAAILGMPAALGATP